MSPIDERTQVYHHLKKELRKIMRKNDFKVQEAILDEQWWEDVKPWFTYDVINNKRVYRQGEVWWSL